MSAIKTSADIRRCINGGWAARVSLFSYMRRYVVGRVTIEWCFACALGHSLD